MSLSTRLILARVLMTLVAVFTVVSPYLADWNATHIYNPRWPPHAKFHNAQTMVLGTLLGLSALVGCWWRNPAPRGPMLMALWLAALYWLSQPVAFLFPGVAWTDPDLLPPGHRLHEFPMQLRGDLGLYGLLLACLWLIVTGTRRTAKP